jgi:hypothetical protein
MVEGHAERHTTIGRVNEPLRSPVANVAAENVTTKQIAGIERRTLAFRNALGGRRTGQNDDAGSMF